MDSAKLGILEPGDLVRVLQTIVLDDGVRRMRTQLGWTSLSSKGGVIFLEAGTPGSRNAGTPPAKVEIAKFLSPTPSDQDSGAPVESAGTPLRTMTAGSTMDPHGLYTVNFRRGEHGFGLELQEISLDSGAIRAQVNAVDPGGAAHSVGIQKGDVVYSVNHVVVADMETLSSQLGVIGDSSVDWTLNRAGSAEEPRAGIPLHDADSTSPLTDKRSAMVPCPEGVVPGDLMLV